MRPKTERKVELQLEYQNYIESAPMAPKQMINQASSSDEITINTWRNIWINNVKTNHKKFGSFKDHSIGALFGSNQYRPVIIAGSGPSLAHNGEQLKNRGDIPLISCLHNYQFFEDRGVKVDYYVTLDAGDVVIEEVYEGGKKTPEEYWESTKDKTLIAYIGSPPALFEKWQGKVLLYNAMVPDQSYIDELNKLEPFNIVLSTGGNVLGACLYLAKAILGSSTVAFVGADFCFGYDKKFHAWNSKYDSKLGYVIKATDVFGNKVLTWQSYSNFKNWFDYIALTVPGIYINCTEGGTFGAYSDGNIMEVKQMSLSDFIHMQTFNERIRPYCADPTHALKDESGRSMVEVLF